MKKEKLIITIFLLLLVAPIFLSEFRLNLLGKYVSFGIAALAIDLLWGYTGILSLGHAVFFGLGGYCMGAYIKLQTETLPDFMMWCGMTELPWFWKPFQYFWFALPMAIILPIFISLLIGIPTFRVGIKGVYFTILTQALALIFVTFFIGQQLYTGGTNGITNLQSIFGFSLSDTKVMQVIYLITVVILIISFLFCRFLVKSNLGRTLIAIRDSENRLKFLGYNPMTYKLFVFAVSAGLAGLAGALFVPQVGIISPSLMGILPSVEMAIWVAVGGRGNLKGAIIGAIVVNFAKSFFSETFPEIWLYFFGLLFVLVVLLFPKGIMGIINNIVNKIKIIKKNRIIHAKTDY